MKRIGSKGSQIDRLTCWDVILGDDELASIVGDGDQVKGKATLGVMKAAQAVDTSNQNFVCAEEFQKLFSSSVMTIPTEDVPGDVVRSGLDPEYLLDL